MPSTDDILILKKRIREAILIQLKKQKGEDRKLRSNRIREKLFILPEFKFAETVMFYVAFNGEVETKQMLEDSIKAGKRTAVPVVRPGTREMFATVVQDLNEGLEKGPFGIMQPRRESARELDPREIDVVVVPGIAFDRKANRLGRGMGYYDRFMAQLRPDAKKIGVGFSFQVVEDIPVSPHDVPLTRILTD